MQGKLAFTLVGGGLHGRHKGEIGQCPKEMGVQPHSESFVELVWHSLLSSVCRGWHAAAVRCLCT